jgi:hypothetical protein
LTEAHRPRRVAVQAGTASITLTSDGVGMTRVSRKPAASSSPRNKEGRVRDRVLAWLASEGIEPTPEAD